ncbi:leukocyte immunoglobulin-like receptor subfamily B member 4 isoform X2 [Grammomys surdaster]|uniref:leukocyte immunoglobulin-like receptor subfamily B member 4 isoform X2 n=1 Tax=Grammomys surdaster TaxID=491861 RepID=UPI00109F233B|nr:leukocyte immunoglobulin-like receptor subfamily B member 4 isoform X2 [Grammomys surdaster]
MGMGRGPLTKPIIWAEPGSVIAKNTSVTIWCQGSWEAQEYLLHKEGRVDPWDRQISMETRNKAMFYIEHTETIYTGLYKCYYNSSAGLSEYSSTLELVVTEAPALQHQGHTVEDLTQMVMAALVLVTLVIVLLEAWYSKRVEQDGTRT